MPNGLALIAVSLLLSGLVASALLSTWTQYQYRSNYRHITVPFAPINSQHRPRETRTSLFASDSDGSDNGEAQFILPTRCSSRDAASIIQNCTANDGLLIITCDASGRGVSSTVFVLNMREIGNHSYHYVHATTMFMKTTGRLKA